MDRAQFDFVADEYHTLHARNIRITGETPEFFAEYKVKDMAAALGPLSSGPLRLLDFGVGVGNSLPFFMCYFPNAAITGVDVSARSLEVAESRFPGAATLVEFDGQQLPFGNGSFDHAFTANVFHHIAPAEHAKHLTDLFRIIRPGGKLFLFEHNPYNPLTSYAFESCDFDQGAQMIPAPRMQRNLRAAGFGPIAIRYRIFFPNLLRGLRPLETFLTKVPLGAQYCAIAEKSSRV